MGALSCSECVSLVCEGTCLHFSVLLAVGAEDRGSAFLPSLSSRRRGSSRLTMSWFKPEGRAKKDLSIDTSVRLSAGSQWSRTANVPSEEPLASFIRVPGDALKRRRRWPSKSDVSGRRDERFVVARGAFIRRSPPVAASIRSAQRARSWARMLGRALSPPSFFFGPNTTTSRVSSQSDRLPYPSSVFFFTRRDVSARLDASRVTRKSSAVAVRRGMALAALGRTSTAGRNTAIPSGALLNTCP